MVVDTSGLEYKGRIANLLASSLLLQIDGQMHRFEMNEVATVHHRDSLVEGVLIGAGVGAALGLWDYLIDPSEPGNGAVTGALVILGGGIGALVDSRHRAALYRAPGRPVAVGPVVVPSYGFTQKLAGVRITLTF